MEEYIQKGQENGINQKWIKQLENASARVHISKLESLKFQIQNEIEGLYGERLESMNDYLTRVYGDTYYKSAFITQVGIGIGKSLNMLDTDRINTIIHKPWAADGKNFSERIWEDKTKLINSLHNGISQAFIRGSSLDEVIKNISKEFGVKKSVAGRLVMTETAAYSSQAKQKCFNDLDVEKYEIIATLDTSTSEICQEMDGKVFSMKDYQIGVTASPFHPNCRTTEAPYFEDDTSSMRAMRGKDGKIDYVPADMKYQEWYDKYIVKDNEKNGIMKEKSYEWNLKEFHSGKEINDYFFEDEDYKKWIKSIGKDGKTAIKRYTDKDFGNLNNYNRKIGIDWAEDGYYGRELKEALKVMGDFEKKFGKKIGENDLIESRAFFNNISDKCKDTIRKIIDIEEWNENLDKTIPNFILKDDIITYRGAGIEAIPKFNDVKELIGKIYTDKTYMSTSPILQESFVGGVVFKIKMPKGNGRGIYVNQISKHKRETEFLLPKNSKFKIINATKGNYLTHLEMEMIVDD